MGHPNERTLKSPGTTQWQSRTRLHRARQTWKIRRLLHPRIPIDCPSLGYLRTRGSPDSGNTLILRCSSSENGGTARFASHLIGEREITREHVTTNDGGGFFSRGHVSTS
jgi:hypothetical protein